MDAFDTLGLGPTLDLDLGVLEQRYRDLLRELHPDRFAQASSSEKRESLSRAVSVNEAYRVLRDPLKRAELLLKRHGAESGKSEPPDTELLMQVLELREALGEARAARDVARVRKLSAEVTAMEEQNLGQLRAALTQLAQGNTSQLAAATRALGRLRYCRRFHDEVSLFEEELLE
jgi:molecular chaperone HscB